MSLGLSGIGKAEASEEQADGTILCRQNASERRRTQQWFAKSTLINAIGFKLGHSCAADQVLSIAQCRSPRCS